MSCNRQKLQEEILIKDIKKEEKNWRPMEKDYSLAYHLLRLTKEELVKIGSKYGVRGLTSLKKADLVDRLIVEIDKNFEYVLKNLDKDRIEYIQKINKIQKFREEEIINVNYFRNRGIIFSGLLDEESYIIMPNEIKAILDRKLNKDAIKESIENSNILKIVGGMAYYYGVISINDIVALLDNRINEQKVKSLIEEAKELNFDYEIEDDLVYHIDVDNFEDILKKQQNADLPYYKFDLKSLIKAGEVDYEEEYKQASNLTRVLGDLFVVDKNIIKKEIESFIISLKNDDKLEESIEDFLQAYEIETDEERNIFNKELVKLSNVIRRWTLKGFTKNEVDARSNKDQKVIKIGRNEPCTCGSGKKYKKCCGK